jgi:DNA invertase Pin-like site-specific DNA recombinase
MSTKIYKAAEYYRLSHTDDKSTESDSIANQRKQLKMFIENQPDIESISEWVDDGISGVLFDRPAFKQMMAEIENGKIDCIIVKDLSRFGREYIETGRYLRRILPAYGVRFIAVNDNIDTVKDKDDDIILSVKTVINDSYCRDISVKTRSALNIKRENGDYVGACPIYGYIKNENNHNQLVIDEYPAGVVRDIFRMKIDGMSALKIADKLNSLGVLSPIEYKKNRDLPHPKGGYADKDGAKWSPNTIIRILQDETYTGALLQGRKGKVNYKIQDIVDRPKSEWKCCENTHEAIIEQHDYDLAQRIMRLDTRSAPDNDSVYILSGILICDSCGAQMTRRSVPYKDTKYHYYFCPTTKKRGCMKAVSIKEEVLHGYILESLKAQIACIVSYDSILTGSDSQRIIDATAQHLLSQIAENERQLEEIYGFKSTIYENMVIGLINTDDYKTLKAKYGADESRLRKATQALQKQHERVLTGTDERLRWMDSFKQFKDIVELNRRIVISLIRSIRLISKNEMAITYNFQDEYKNAMSLLKEVAA